MYQYRISIIVTILQYVVSIPQSPSQLDRFDYGTPRTIDNPDILKLIILHTNDMHGRFAETSALSGQCNSTAGETCYGGFGRVATKAREIRHAAAADGSDVLFLNAGDTYTGSVLFSQFRADISSKFVNLLEFDALALGNHEFDYGVNELIPFLNDTKATIICANINVTTEPKFDQYRNLIQPSVIKTIKGHKIGIIGYLVNETVHLANTENVTFFYEVDAINMEAMKLHLQGVKTIIAVGHSGFDIDKEIAERCPLVDIVVGGHSNTFLYTGTAPDLEPAEGKYPYIVTQPSGKEVPLVQAYAFTKYLGELHVDLDHNGKVIRSWGNPILLTGDIPQSEDALQLLEYYQKKNRETNIVVAHSRVTLENRYCRLQECNIGNLVTDAMIWYYLKSRKQDGFWTDAPIALFNSGGIRTSFYGNRTNNGSFPITKFDIEEVFPFRNWLGSTTLTGAELLSVFELAAKRHYKTHGGFPQVSGVHVVYDITDPKNYKVESVRVRCGACHVPRYEDLDLTKTYRIVLFNFLAKGGDDYPIFRTKQFDAIRKDNAEVRDVDLVTEYMQKVSPIVYGLEERIVLKRVTGRGDIKRERSSGHKVSSSILLLSFVFLFFLSK